MFIEIESINKKSAIENIEFEKRQITFFLGDFFYLNFESAEEKTEFLSWFMKNKDSNFLYGHSYVQLDDVLINKHTEKDNIAIQQINRFDVKSYKFIKKDGHLEICFLSNNEKLEFVLFKEIIDKILNKLN